MPFHWSRMRASWVGAAIVVLGTGAGLQAQSPRVLYTWSGTENTRGWTANSPLLTLENTTDGELTLTEVGLVEIDIGVNDDFNNIVETSPIIGGLDLTGLAAIEFDLGHDGAKPVNVQFFVQATISSTFVALGPDQAIEPGVHTYSAPLEILSPVEITYIRSVGFIIRPHLEQENLVWTLREVRSAGAPADVRDIATHEEGTPDAGLQGALVNFDNMGVEDNDLSQNQTGLSHNTAAPPAGNTGSLHWVDLGAGPGGAITWGNGTALNGNTFWERPTDLSSYTEIRLRLAATRRGEGVEETVGVQYFLQTGNFEFFAVAGDIQQLPIDGEFHELTFPIGSLPSIHFTMQHGVNIQGHTDDIIFDVDHVRAAFVANFPDCNANRTPDERDIIDGTSRDCNANGVPDECDLAGASSPDCNTNGIPDECDIARDPEARILYTWEGVDNLRGWMQAFPDPVGDPKGTLENSVDGTLIYSEFDDGNGAGLSDSFDVIAEESPLFGGLDLTGATAIEFDLGHDGIAPINVQFYVQATPSSLYIPLGPDQAIEPGMATYTAPLDILTPAQLTYLRTVGVNIRNHSDIGNVVWTFEEVRSVGSPPTRRDYATHGPGTSDNGLQGAAAAFDLAAILGNDGGQNQTGLTHNLTGSPPGNNGSLRWTDIPEQGGGAVAWFNGTALFEGNTFFERPTDMSSYNRVVVRLAATNIEGGNVPSVELEYFLLTGNFEYQAAGLIEVLPADGQFHAITFPIDAIADRRYVQGHGINLQEHDGGTLIIDVDSIRALGPGNEETDCNGNSVPDTCDIASGLEQDLNQNGKPDSCEEEPGVAFKRGDCNLDGNANITDGIFLLNFLFLGGTRPGCMAACDNNGSGQLNITNAVYIFNFLFLGGPDPPPPHPDCGPPRPQDATLGCNASSQGCA